VSRARRLEFGSSENDSKKTETEEFKQKLFDFELSKIPRLKNFAQWCYLR